MHSDLNPMYSIFMKNYLPNTIRVSNDQVIHLVWVGKMSGLVWINIGLQRLSVNDTIRHTFKVDMVFSKMNSLTKAYYFLVAVNWKPSIGFHLFSPLSSFLVSFNIGTNKGMPKYCWGFLHVMNLSPLPTVQNSSIV